MDSKNISSLVDPYSMPDRELERYLIDQGKAELELVNQLETPVGSWQEIESNLLKVETGVKSEYQQVKTKNITAWSKMLTIAASVSFILVGLLSWQNYKLQSQLKSVLVANYLFEEQFSKSSRTTYVGFSSELVNLEKELQSAKNTEEKLNILIKRKAIFEKQLNPKKGVSNEFSI